MKEINLERERRTARLLQVGWTVFLVAVQWALWTFIVHSGGDVPVDVAILLSSLCMLVGVLVLSLCTILGGELHDYITGESRDIKQRWMYKIWTAPLVFQERREAKRELQKQRTRQLELEIRELDAFLRKEGVIV